ncbi:PilW family protein [Vibrio sp.]|uniref:PilW family protein n=1 Tax=Vibrio sp. TaxID=678 RepID=UPI003D0ACEFC
MKKRVGQKVSRNHKKGFTFIELLIAMVIVAIVSGAVIMLGYTYFNHFEQSNELSMARERAIMVATYLERRILNAGLGMPSSGDSFTKAFEGLWDNGDFVGEEWDREVFKPQDDGASFINELMIAYAMPSGMRTLEYSQVGTGGESIGLSSLDTSKIKKNDKITTKGWIVFPSQRMPFFITDYDTTNTTITLRSEISGTWAIPANEELHLVRFLHAYVENETFKVNDLTIADNQPIVEGILSCKFSYEESTNLLEVSILARGNKQYSSYVAPADLKGWGTIENDDWRKYHLTVVNKGWRVRN